MDKRKPPKISKKLPPLPPSAAPHLMPFLKKINTSSAPQDPIRKLHARIKSLEEFKEVQVRQNTIVSQGQKHQNALIAQLIECTENLQLMQETVNQRLENLEKNSILRAEYDHRATAHHVKLLKLKLEGIEQELSTYHCPISQTIPKEPVIAEDEHTYDKAELVKWIEKCGTSPLIPSMRLSKDKLIRNRFVEDRIKKLLEEKAKLNIQIGKEENIKIGISRQSSKDQSIAEDDKETEAYESHLSIGMQVSK